MWAISQSYVLRWKQKWMWRTGAGDSAGSWLRSDEQSTEAEQSKAIRLKAISCWKAVSVIATERSVPRFAYKPVSVLLFYIWVQTPSVIVSINFSKMELKIKDNKFVSVKQTNNLLWSPPPRITKSCQHRHHFWLHDWLPSADTLAFAPVWFLKECDRRISCLSAVEASQTKLWQL